MSAPSLDRLGQALADRYTLIREIGQGGMATVYLAEDLRLHRQVALKVLRPEISRSLGPERFLHEIDVAARLQHPHILSLLDAGQVEVEAGPPGLYYTMPFVAGESLRSRLERETYLGLEEALRLTREVADALGHAHSRGIVHRDIKPENILLSEGHAVVADFGIAKAVTSTGQRFTQTEVTLGTPHYMSPEQADSSRPVDGRSDLYSLGCVLYEMLAGQPPFTAPTAQAVLARHALDPVPSLRTLRETVPASVEVAITRALAKVPADRFASVEAFVSALTVAHPTGGRQPVTAAATPVAKKPFAIAGGVILAGAAAVGAVILWPSEPEYVPNRVVVVPFEGQGADPSLQEFGRQMVATLTDAIGQEGVGDPVPAARVRDLLAGAGTVSAGIADWLARETAAGLVLRGVCSPRGGRTQCQLELLRMPGRIPRLSITVAGDPNDPGFSAELAERATAILLLHQRWGDRATWRGEYIPGSLEAIRELNEGFDLWTVYDTNAARHFRRAAMLDTSWVLAAVWSDHHDSVLERLGRRPGLRASDRETIGLFQAGNRGERERIYDLASRRFAVNPEMWLSEAVWTAYASQRPEAATRYFRLVDSVLRVQVWVYRNAAYALHHLGRYQDEVNLAARMRERFPQHPTDYRTVEIMGRAGAGDLDGVRRVVAEAEATSERDRNWAGTRTWIAGIELMAHGQEAEGRRMLVASLPFYRRLREENGPSGSGNLDLQILLITDRLDEASALALDALPGLKTAADSAGVLGLLGQIAARRGQRDQALRYSDQLDRLDRNRALYHRASIAARLGDREAAVRFLEAGREVWSVAGFEGLHRDPHLASLRGYPPFEQLLKPKG